MPTNLIALTRRLVFAWTSATVVTLAVFVVELLGKASVNSLLVVGISLSSALIQLGFALLTLRHRTREARVNHPLVSER